MSEFVHVVYQSPFVQLIGLLKGNILKGAAYTFKEKYKMNCLIVNKRATHSLKPCMVLLNRCIFNVFILHKKSLSILFFSPLTGVITTMIM